MATKLVRLVNDKKKSFNTSNSGNFILYYYYNHDKLI